MIRHGALTILLLSLGVSIFAQAAQDHSPQGQAVARNETVIFDLDGGPVVEPGHWNHFLPDRRLVHGFHQALMEPLFILNYETGEIEPWLATAMTANETYDVWTLKLRPGVEWSDGENFDADDVVFTIQMLLDNTHDLLFSSDLTHWIDKVEKLDNLSVRFTLKRPNPRFQLDYWSVRRFTNPSIVPEHIWRDKDPTTFKNYDPAKGWPVFTGPYTLEKAKSEQFVYRRNNNWWGAKSGWKPLPKPKRLVWRWIGDEQKRTDAMVRNDLDNVLDIPLSLLLDLKRDNKSILTHFNDLPYAWVPDPCVRNLELNHSVAPWNDKKMRWALNHAINRDEIVAFAYQGTTLHARHFFPSYPPLNRYVDLLDAAGLYSKFPLLEHNREKARQLIESAGYQLNKDGLYEKDGETLSIDIATHGAFVEKQRIAKVVVEQLRRTGIDASTHNEPATTWYKNFELGKFEGRIGWQACNSVNEPWASMDNFNTKWLKPVGKLTGMNQNAWRWKGKAAERYSDLVDLISSLPVGDSRIDKPYVLAMEIWMDELPIIPLTQARKVMPFNTTYWKGWPTANNNYIHPPTWWQSTHAIIHNLEPVKR